MIRKAPCQAQSRPKGYGPGPPSFFTWAAPSTVLCLFSEFFCLGRWDLGIVGALGLGTSGSEAAECRLHSFASACTQGNIESGNEVATTCILPSAHQLGSARLQPSVRNSGALYLESKICRPTEKKSLYMKPAKIAKKPVQVNTSLRQNCSCQQSPLARAAEQPKLTTMYRAVNKDGWVNRKVSAFMQSQIPARNSRMP